MSAREKVKKNIKNIIKEEENHEKNRITVKKAITTAKDKIDSTVKNLGLTNNARTKIDSLLSFTENDSDDKYSPFEQINGNKSSISQIENSIPEFGIEKIESNPDKSVKKIHYSMLTDTKEYIDKIDEYYKNTIAAIEETHNSNQNEISKVTPLSRPLMQ
ncbi:MAG: hypothetical protein GY821_04520 [Gammaproteobacteria bacterium]|nr:hypothetical protein [Gammaproteobacteria bacterium]